jgi:DNA-binding HxlR family transcriptional regulator
MNQKFLKLKTINSIDKLVLMLMLDVNKILIITLRAGDMAKDLGTTRKVIAESLENLVKVGYITTKVHSSSYSRTSVLTPEFLTLISE